MLEQSSTEHAKHARRVMLAVDEFYPIPKPFDNLTKAESREAISRGVPKAIITFLEKGGDPRKFALKEWGWVRTARNSINVWKLDEDSLRLLRLWVKQLNLDPYETFDLEEIATGERLTVNARQLRNAGVTVAALRAYGQGVGRFRNPDSDSPAAENVLDVLRARAEDSLGNTLSEAEWEAIVAEYNRRLEGFIQFWDREPDGEEVLLLIAQIDMQTFAYAPAEDIRKPASLRTQLARQAVGQQTFMFAEEAKRPDGVWTPIDECVVLFLEEHGIGELEHDAIEKVVHAIRKNFGFDSLLPLGNGSFATAFYTPNQTALKITFDLEDVKAAHLVRERPAVNLVTVYGAGNTQASVYWGYGERSQIAGKSSRIGLIECAYVPFDFRDAFPDEGGRISNQIGNIVANIKDEHGVWPSDLHRLGSAKINAIRDAQENLIERLDKMNSRLRDTNARIVSELIKGLLELQERGVYSVDFHASNSRWTGEKLVLTDFGAGSVDWKGRTKRYRNPEEAAVVLFHPDTTEPDEY